MTIIQKGEPMLKVPYGQDPYSVIGKYIRDHIAVIEDMIAVIEIDDITTNQLFMVDMNEENYFIWNIDWYEGEKEVALVDFFPVSEAINQSAQPKPFMVTIDHELTKDEVERLKQSMSNTPIVLFPSVQPEPQWIPCSERLPDHPENNDYYLVTIQCEHHDGWDDYVTGFAEWTKYGWDELSCYIGQIKVIAWMPLPEPYKERWEDG